MGEGGSSSKNSTTKMNNTQICWGLGGGRPYEFITGGRYTQVIPPCRLNCYSYSVWLDVSSTSTKLHIGAAP